MTLTVSKLVILDKNIIAWHYFIYILNAVRDIVVWRTFVNDNRFVLKVSSRVGRWWKDKYDFHVVLMTFSTGSLKYVRNSRWQFRTFIRITGTRSTNLDPKFRRIYARTKFPTFNVTALVPNSSSSWSTICNYTCRLLRHVCRAWCFDKQRHTHVSQGVQRSFSAATTTICLHCGIRRA